MWVQNLLCLTSDDFTLSIARQFYLLRGERWHSMGYSWPVPQICHTNPVNHNQILILIILTNFDPSNYLTSEPHSQP
jgi:hypothetical protein